MILLTQNRLRSRKGIEATAPTGGMAVAAFAIEEALVGEHEFSACAALTELDSDQNFTGSGSLSHCQVKTAEKIGESESPLLTIWLKIYASRALSSILSAPGQSGPNDKPDQSAQSLIRLPGAGACPARRRSSLRQCRRRDSSRFRLYRHDGPSGRAARGDCQLRPN
jgi:hypothetical protein